MGGKIFANNLLNRSNDESVRTFRTDRYKYHSEKEGISELGIKIKHIVENLCVIIDIF